MKLRTKILSYTLPLILIPFLLMAVAVYYFVIRANQIQIQEERSQRLNEAIVSFGQEVDSAKRDIQLLSNVPAITDYLDIDSTSSVDKPIQESQAKIILELFFKQNPYYSQLSLVNEKGLEVIKFSKLPKEQELKNVKKEVFFRRTLITGGEQTPVREIQLNKYATTFTQAISSNRFLGMLVLTLNTEVFERPMRPLLKSDQITFLFDDRGLIFADNFRSNEDKNLLSKIDLSKSAKEFLNDSSFEIGKREILTGKNNYLLSFLPSETFPKVGTYQNQDGSTWFLGVLEPQKSTPIPFAFQAVFFSIFFLAIGAVLFLTAKASRYITIPLEKVSTATGKIARGNSDLDLDIKTGDEVEDLANAVNRMSHDLQDYQKQLVQSAKLATMGEMTAEISHEIQNRISGISLWLQHLDSEIENDDPRQEYLDEMKQGLKGFMEMLANLKEYYKTPVLDKSDFDLNILIQEALPFVQERLDEKQTQIDTEFSSSLPIFIADREKLKGVILNLLLNAVDASKENGKIQIITDVNDESGEVYVEFIDDGKGIDENDFSRIFYPFYSTKSGGSGLGLAISSNIISAHKGRIDVKSEIGKGTIFKVLIPFNKS